MKQIPLDVDLYSITKEMESTGLPKQFILDFLRLSREYNAIYKMAKIWIEEKDLHEKNEIIADIQEMIDDCEEQLKIEASDLSLDDLDELLTKITSIKNDLYKKVIEFGGIDKLSKLTEIPIPALKRFFDSGSIPAGKTYEKIIKALNEKHVATDVTEKPAPYC